MKCTEKSLMAPESHGSFQLLTVSRLPQYHHKATIAIEHDQMKRQLGGNTLKEWYATLQECRICIPLCISFMWCYPQKNCKYLCTSKSQGSTLSIRFLGCLIKNLLTLTLSQDKGFHILASTLGDMANTYGKIHVSGNPGMESGAVDYHHSQHGNSYPVSGKFSS